MQPGTPIHSVPSATRAAACAMSCARRLLVNNRALLDLSFTGLIFPAGNSFAPVVGFQFIQLVMIVDLIACAGRQSSQRRSTEERTATLAETDQKCERQN